VVMIDEVVHGKVKPEQVRALLETYRSRARGE
jgi:NADH:ubiquinone oxidoreductase subunit E